MPQTSDPRWVVPERGSKAAMSLAIWLARRLGWRRLRVLLWPIAFYFFLFNKSARYASRAYLARNLHRHISSRLVLRHFHAFGQTVLDRLFFLLAPQTMLPVRCHGREIFQRIMEQGQGALLLGAHIGSFEALRTLAQDHGVPVRMLMYRSNLGGATQVLEALDPDYLQNIIPIGQTDSMLQVAESLKRGEVIGILADRSPDTSHCIAVPFFGKNVMLPEGPYRLALATGAPIVFVSSVKNSDGIYDVTFSSFDVPYPVQRQDRAAFIQKGALCYSRWLEDQCTQHPLSWFNFYDYWKDLT